MRLVDLSHEIEHELTTHPGVPGPRITQHLTFEASRDRYAPGTEFSIGRIDLVSSTGTYLDTPAHRYPDGHDLCGLPLDRCADLPTVVVDGTGAIGADRVERVSVRGAAVLLRTGWDRYWGTPHYGDPSHPHLTESGATALVAAGAVLVGIDAVNIDASTTGERPAHTTLLGAGVLVVENLTGLAAVPRAGARFTAVPPRIRGLWSFPVRAFATLP